MSRDEGVIADAVIAELQSAGFSVQRQGNNVWTEFGDALRPRLLLNSHLDTVPPGSGWSGDPWTVRRIDDRIIGLGANDAKGCVAAMMQAALRMKSASADTRLNGTLVLALTVEEEISGQGLGTIRSHLEPIDAALVGEPTSLVPMTAQRGLLIVRGVARGRTRHPANTPANSPDNAITSAVAALARLRDFDWGPIHPLLGRCHGHVTMLNGGVARNVIPDSCEFWLDVRTTPAEANLAVFERLRGLIGAAADLHIHSERLVPVETKESEPIVQAILRAIPSTRPAGSPAMSDMVFLAGIPAVKIGPGDTHRSHTPDEYITVSELEAGARAYEAIIRSYFGI